MASCIMQHLPSTDQPLSKIEEDTDRDRYMSPLEAKEYGIIDHIIGGEEVRGQPANPCCYQWPNLLPKTLTWLPGRA